jgi:hypothetical protein
VGVVLVARNRATQGFLIGDLEAMRIRMVRDPPVGRNTLQASVPLGPYTTHDQGRQLY